jgi:hypothetical protein
MKLSRGKLLSQLFMHNTNTISKGNELESAHKA